MDSENEGSDELPEVVIKPGRTELRGIPEDHPAVQLALERARELEAQRDAGRFFCSGCGKHIQPREGFVPEGPGRRRGKPTPLRIYCLMCAEARGMFGDESLS